MKIQNFTPQFFFFFFNIKYFQSVISITQLVNLKILTQNKHGKIRGETEGGPPEWELSEFVES